MNLLIRLNPRQVAAWLFTIITILATLHLITNYMVQIIGVGNITKEIFLRFSLDSEISLPTWYSQFLLLISSAILLIIGYSKKNKLKEYHHHWVGLGYIFLYLSIDEGSSLHELFNPIVKRLGNYEIFNTYLYFAWVVVGVAFFVIIAAIYFKFWLKLPRKTRWLFFLSASIYLGGAVGVEMLEAAYAAPRGVDFMYYVMNMFEESMEMAGIALFIYCLLDYAKGQSIKTTLDLR